MEVGTKSLDVRARLKDVLVIYLNMKSFNGTCLLSCFELMDG